MQLDDKQAERLEEKAAAIGNLIGSQIPEGWGFALMIFTFGEGGTMSYISNAQRDDMIKALREQADVLERHGDSPPVRWRKG